MALAEASLSLSPTASVRVREKVCTKLSCTVQSVAVRQPIGRAIGIFIISYNYSRNIVFIHFIEFLLPQVFVHTALHPQSLNTAFHSQRRRSSPQRESVSHPSSIFPLSIHPLFTSSSHRLTTRHHTILAICYCYTCAAGVTKTSFYVHAAQVLVVVVLAAAAACGTPASPAQSHDLGVWLYS